jgi:hypothetical protein
MRNRDHLFAVKLLALAWLVPGAAALAEEATNWETIKSGPVVIKRRVVAGSDIKEVYAEGTLKAEVKDIQAALTDVPRFVDFMPYCNEARLVAAEPDGAKFIYQRLDLPVLTSRDFIHKMYIDRDAHTDPNGAFANHWFAVPDKIPERNGYIRLRVSEGSWLVTPGENGTAHVVYRLRVDPGGLVPSFAANFGNHDGILNTFKAVEAQAQLRADKKNASASVSTKK